MDARQKNLLTALPSLPPYQRLANEISLDFPEFRSHLKRASLPSLFPDRSRVVRPSLLMINRRKRARRTRSTQGKGRRRSRRKRRAKRNERKGVGEIEEEEEKVVVQEEEEEEKEQRISEVAKKKD